jgi:hypothetical protein
MPRLDIAKRSELVRSRSLRRTPASQSLIPILLAPLGRTVAVAQDRSRLLQDSAETEHLRTCGRTRKSLARAHLADPKEASAMERSASPILKEANRPNTHAAFFAGSSSTTVAMSGASLKRVSA